MGVVVNKNGDELLAFIKMDESEINHPIAGSLIVVESQKKYLIGLNPWRKQWEIPGGRRDLGETPKDCAIRELYEETKQKVSEVEFIGLAKILKKVNKKIQYYAVYYAYKEKIEPFKGNREMKKIMLWDLQEPIGYVDKIDMKIIESC